ncbi:DENN domain-containing protein 2B-like [Lethenteron reissneri]|uniref:DENN domain-containing protein 2B-like n=1 Tax=Lethenteron reissneri TaxID=7753 RepID=UPI002AB60F7E|nr:DENN domain-containing protein 2B-like [Lethenteron reissneri]
MTTVVPSLESSAPSSSSAPAHRMPVHRPLSQSLLSLPSAGPQSSALRAQCRPHTLKLASSEVDVCGVRGGRRGDGCRAGGPPGGYALRRTRARDLSCEPTTPTNPDGDFDLSAERGAECGFRRRPPPRQNGLVNGGALNSRPSRDGTATTAAAVAAPEAGARAANARGRAEVIRQRIERWEGRQGDADSGNGGGAVGRGLVTPKEPAAPTGPERQQTRMKKEEEGVKPGEVREPLAGPRSPGREAGTAAGVIQRTPLPDKSLSATTGGGGEVTLLDECGRSMTGAAAARERAGSAQSPGARRDFTGNADGVRTRTCGGSDSCKPLAEALTNNKCLFIKTTNTDASLNNNVSGGVGLVPGGEKVAAVRASTACAGQPKAGPTEGWYCTPAHPQPKPAAAARVLPGAQTERRGGLQESVNGKSSERREHGGCSGEAVGRAAGGVTRTASDRIADSSANARAGDRASSRCGATGATANSEGMGSPTMRPGRGASDVDAGRRVAEGRGAGSESPRAIGATVGCVPPGELDGTRKEASPAGEAAPRSGGKRGGVASVLSRVRTLERAAQDCPNHGVPELPGIFYGAREARRSRAGLGPRGPGTSRERRGSPAMAARQRRDSRGSEPSETDYSTVGSVYSARGDAPWDSENVYADPALCDSPSPTPSPARTLSPPPADAPPKPRRTFEYRAGPFEGGGGGGDAQRPPAPSPAPPSSLLPPPSSPAPPLPSSPPPCSTQPPPPLPRPAQDCSRLSSPEPSTVPSRPRVPLQELPLPPFQPHSPEFGLALSHENIYEDIIEPCSRENPYEDIADGEWASSLEDSSSLCLRSAPGKSRSATLSEPRLPPWGGGGRRGVGPGTRGGGRTSSLRAPRPGRAGAAARGSPSSLLFAGGGLDEEWGAGAVPARAPKSVQKINSIFTARCGWKRWKKTSVSSPESLKDENSDSESDSDEQLTEHRLRLVHVAAALRRARSGRTLELEQLDPHNRRLFEHFVVVSLRERPAGAVGPGPPGTFTPQLTYQFPKLERPSQEAREAEERLKVIPHFCFPDVRELGPVVGPGAPEGPRGPCPSETFSFVLTYEDGIRRFGYCRRLTPEGKGLPEVYCIISRLGCFTLFSKILDEVEKRRCMSPALVYPFMRVLADAPFPAPGRTVRFKNFLPGSGNEVIELRRPLDSRLEHVDFSCLLACLGTRHIVQVFASLLLERRIILTADRLSTLSQCGHAIAALLYPFAWQHTLVPVLPACMLDIACAPTPFLIGVLSSALPRLRELPIEEVLLVDLCGDRFLRQLDDEDSILPRKLQGALEHALEQRHELCARGPDSSGEEAEGQEDAGDGNQDRGPLDRFVSEAFVRFFVETVGHYSLHLDALEGRERRAEPGGRRERAERRLQRETFRKAVASKSTRRFLELFMETQMFAGFVHEREARRACPRGLFEVRAAQYLAETPEAERGGVNRFLKGLGNRMKFLSKK